MKLSQEVENTGVTLHIPNAYCGPGHDSCFVETTLLVLITSKEDFIPFMDEKVDVHEQSISCL